jgi:hypothetical protein
MHADVKVLIEKLPTFKGKKEYFKHYWKTIVEVPCRVKMIYKLHRYVESQF